MNIGDPRRILEVEPKELPFEAPAYVPTEPNPLVEEPAPVLVPAGAPEEPEGL